MNHSANIIAPTGTCCGLFVDFSESPALQADGALVSAPFIATQISWKVVSGVVATRWSDFYRRSASQLQVRRPSRCVCSIPYSWESIKADVGSLSRFRRPLRVEHTLLLSVTSVWGAEFRETQACECDPSP